MQKAESLLASDKLQCKNGNKVNLLMQTRLKFRLENGFF